MSCLKPKDGISAITHHGLIYCECDMQELKDGISELITEFNDGYIDTKILELL